MYDDLTPAGDLLHDPAPAHDAGAIRFVQRRDVGDVINATFAFLRENWRELGRGLLFVVGPLALLAALASILAQLHVERAFSEVDTVPIDNPFWMLQAFLSPAYAITVLLGFLTPLAVTASTLAYIECYRQGEEGAIAPGRLWTVVRTMLVPVASVWLIFLALFILGLLIVLVPCLGALAYAAGVLYSVPIAALTLVARAYERDTFGAALQRTRELVKGNWLRSFGVVFIVGLIVAAISVVLAIPNLLVGGGFQLNTLADEISSGQRLAMAFSTLFATLAYIVAYPIPIRGSDVSVLRARRRRRGHDALRPARCARRLLGVRGRACRGDHAFLARDVRAYQALARRGYREKRQVSGRRI